MKKLILLFSFFSVFLSGICQERMEILFWNLENLFHPSDDSISADEEFTPEGQRAWSYSRYYRKINMVWKSFLALSEKDAPALIAVCEIENLQVMKDIFVNSPLSVYSYRIIHHDSPDARGIDVALAYRPEILTPLDTAFLEVNFPESGGRASRDILFCRFRWNTDIFDIYVNHWPSKYGGVGFTDVLRIKTAERLLNSIHQKSQDVNLICCGDFNDIPGSRSLNLLGNWSEGRENETALHRLEAFSSRVDGSLKYQGKWELIDHFFVSEGMLDGKDNIGIENKKAMICDHEFLLEKDEQGGGFLPKRTYQGYKYLGGISDHLPVKICLFRIEETD